MLRSLSKQTAPNSPIPTKLVFETLTAKIRETDVSVGGGKITSHAGEAVKVVDANYLTSSRPTIHIRSAW